MVNLNIELPEKFLEEEVRCGYTVTRQRKEVWAIELDLLNEFDRVCKKYNIKYYADGGTVLGAVRHKGFIPWDDDIDLGIDRKNYIKLCEHASDFKYPYFFQTEDTDFGSFRGHAQLRRSDTTAILKSEEKYKMTFNQGIFIDIFPYDKVPVESMEREKFFKRLQHKRNIFGKAYGVLMGISSSNCLKKYLKKLVRNIYLLVDKNNLLLKYIFYKYEEEKSRYIDLDVSLYRNIQMTNMDDPKVMDGLYFSEKPIMMDFEFVQIPIPYNYHEYLTIAYGDYSVFRIGESCHGGIYFDTNKSYVEYIKEGKKK